MNNQRRVLIIGWDGATFDLILPWVEEGLMPNLSRMMRQGSYRRLRSTIPTLSPPAWTTFITGKNPGRHGMFDFFHRDPNSYELMYSQNDLSGLGTLFHWISQSGRKVGAMNVPMTYPPEPLNGFMISGLGAAAEWDFVYPAELKSEILNLGYRIDSPVFYENSNEDAFLDAAMETTRLRAEVALQLMSTQSWDLFMAVFMSIDQILSFMWHHIDQGHPRYDPAVSPKYSNIALDLHRYLDDVLGKMIDQAGPDTTVIVASDHGMGPLYKEVFLNQWLADNGYLVRRAASTASIKYSDLARKLGFSRQRIWRTIGQSRTRTAKKLLPRRLHGLVPQEHRTLTEAIEWTKTRAYSLGNVGQIYVNLRGREPKGIVSPGPEYETLVAQLIRDLNGFVDKDDGKPVVDKILRKEELYDGPHLHDAPDLNIIMRDYSYITAAQREFAFDTILKPFSKMSGFHRRDGILIISGPDVAAASLPTADIGQVTPTVLYSFGLPIPDDMDGAPMLDLFEEQHVAQNPVQRHQVHRKTTRDRSRVTPEQEQEIQKRLKDLGYLD